MADFRVITQNLGFDGDVSPPWQMVPVSGTRLVALAGGTGLRLCSTDPSVATATEVRSSASGGGGSAAPGTRTIEIRGNRVGRAFIEAQSGSRTACRLEIAVKRLKTVRIAFNFVKDNAGHQTRRAAASVGAWISSMNNILTPQANVRCTRRSAQTVRVNQDLGTVVRYSSHIRGVAASEHEWDDVVALRDRTADLNIFFVWEYEQDSTPATDNAGAGQLGTDCLFEDNVLGAVGTVLAHETGHYLNCPDVRGSGNQSLLMYYHGSRNGVRITKAHANLMNP